MKEGTNPPVFNNNTGGVNPGSSSNPNLGYELTDDEMTAMFGNRPGQSSGSLPYTDIRGSDKGPIILDSHKLNNDLDFITNNMEIGQDGVSNGVDGRKYSYSKRDSYSRGPIIRQDNIDGVSNIFSPHIIINPPIFGMDTGIGSNNANYTMYEDGIL